MPESDHKGECPFCDYAGPNPVLWERSGVIIFEPLNPVTPGHLLAVPRLHANDFADSVGAARAVMEAAALYVRERGLDDCNLITSRGPAATQTVGHFHLHIVPRREGDGLALPWSDVVPRSQLDAVVEAAKNDVLSRLIYWSRKENDRELKRLGKGKITYERYCGGENAHAELEREIQRLRAALSEQPEEPT